MSFLSPLFLVGLGAIAVPIFIHLIQRERKRVIAFPSLMFLQRIPYHSVRRRRIRHWLLLAMRVAAIALLVLAFARPFLQQGASAAAITGGAREVVILLDHSASMGYGDHWQRAKNEAHKVVSSLGSNDRATLVLFGRNAEENMRATPDRARLDAAINAAKVTADGTRYGPALKLASSILSRSTMKRREAVLISDFQKAGWGSSEDARFPDGITLTTTSVASENTSNISVPSLTFARSAFSGQERVAVTAGITNKGDQPARDVPVVLTVDGHEIETKPVTVAAHASASVTFAPFTVAEANVRGTVRAGNDPLPADNSFFFVVSPSEPVGVAIVESDPAGSLYLEKALAIGETPSFQTEVIPVNRATPAMFDKKSVVIFNDTVIPSAVGGGALKRFVERGGGVLVLAGEHTSWPMEDADLLPGKIGGVVDRFTGRSATLGFLDYSHQVFEIFKAPRRGDFSSAHMFRYRTLEMLDPSARVLARYDDGAVAAAERRTGAGRVIVWTSTLDDTWTDLPKRPVYLPLVHQLVRYVARYEQTPSWMTVGQVIDLASTAAKIRTDRAIVTPSGERINQKANASGLLELDEQGVYEVRPVGASSGRPLALAVNIDPAEADLTALDPRELVASVTGHATPVTPDEGAPGTTSREESEKRQALWWDLMFAGLLLLAAESVVANRLSRKEKFL